MGNNTIIGYNILAKRAIETESGINIDEALKKITAYRVVRGEGDDNHPSSEVTVSTKIIYFTKTDKGYLGWIWVDGEGWVCAGGGSSDSWKVWSEEHGCSSTGDRSVYIGEDNTSEGQFQNYQIGHDNTVDGEVPENVEDAGEVVSFNLGAKNTIHGEGFNIGKKNTSEHFGVAIGQINTATHAGVAIGENNTATMSSIAIGKNCNATYNGYTLGEGNGASYSGLVIGFYNGSVSGPSTIVGHNNNTSNLDAGGGNSQYGVAIGEFNCIKGSSTSALGIGALSKNCSMAISSKGSANSNSGNAMAFNASFAIGQRGVYAYHNSFAIGRENAGANSGSFTIGSTSAYSCGDSIAIGMTSATAVQNSISIGREYVYSWNDSIAIGRCSSKADYNSIAIGEYNVYAWNSSLALGIEEAKASLSSVTLGLQNVRSYNSGLAVGRAGTFAYNASCAFGNAACAGDGSLAITNNNTGIKANTWNLENKPFFAYQADDNKWYYVEAKFSGVTKSGNEYIGKSGARYTNPDSIPMSEYDIQIRGYKDENDRIVPFCGVNPDRVNKRIIEIPESWVTVDSSKINKVVSPDPTYFGICAATSNSVILGNQAFATGGSLAISQSSPTGGLDYTFNTQTSNNILSESTIRCGTVITRDGKKYLRSAAFYEAIANENSIAIGHATLATNKSFTFGTMVEARTGSMALGFGFDSTELSEEAYGNANGTSLLIAGLSAENTRGQASGRSIAIGTGVNGIDESIAIGNLTSSNQLSVAIGKQNSSGNESVAIGDGNESNLNAISIGSRNLASGWSIALGVNNTSYDGLGGHATMIGQFNTSTSNQEVIHKELGEQFIPGEPYVPTESDIGTISLYRSNMTNILSTSLTTYEMGLFNEYFDGVEAYNLCRTDVPPSPTPELENLFNELITVPVYVISDEDKATWTEAYNNMDFSWPGIRDWYVALLTVMVKYNSAVSSALSDIRNATTQEELEIAVTNHQEVNSIWMDFMSSVNYEGEPVVGRLEPQQFSEFYNNYTLYFRFLEGIRTQIINSSKGHYETIEEDVVCNSFLVGNHNTSNHYNSILIGALNESKTPLVQPDPTYHTTDDDGFMIAIGYRNEVGRNYDIAIGYKSKAIGGENVAIQHSTAGDGNNSYHNLAMFDSTALGTGNVAIQQSTAGNGNNSYHNLAMFDSTALGTGNIALQHSTTDGYRNLVAFDSSIEGTGNISIMESNPNITLSKSAAAVTSSVLHNMLLNTKVNVEGNNWYDESDGTHMFIKNIMANCKLDGNVYNKQQSKACGLYAYTVGYNIMSNLYRGRIDSYSIWDNVLLGNDTEEHQSYDYEYARYDVNNTESFSRNFIFRPRNGSNNYSTGETFNGGIRITDTLAFDDNVLFLSSIDIPNDPSGDVSNYKYRYVSNNFLMHSRLIGNPKAVVDNVLFGDSIISSDYVDVSTGTTAISNNFLLNSKLYATGAGHANSNAWTVLNTNFLIGTYATDTCATFSFNDFGAGYGHEPYKITKTYRCANFGDNTITAANDTMVQGSSNNILGIIHSAVLGNANVTDGTDDFKAYVENSLWLSSGMSELHILGSSNLVYHKRSSEEETHERFGYLSRSTILGCENHILGSDLGGNVIIGDLNELNDDYPTLTQADLDTVQNSLGTLTEYHRLTDFTVAYDISNGQKRAITQNSQISTDIAFVNDRIAYYYTSSKINITWTDFATQYNNGTLANGYYRIEGTKNVSLLTRTLYMGRQYDKFDIITVENGIVSEQHESEINPESYEHRQAAHGSTYNIMLGRYNLVRSQIHNYTLVGSTNEIMNTHTAPEDEYGGYNIRTAISGGFLQGNDNYAEDGSNIILMGNGNTGYGHNAVAIGCQLEARHWQTVIGKYNQPIDGPDRLTSPDTQSESTKALFIIGNGYSTHDDNKWQDEQYITRSNAMVVYADGTVKAKAFVSDEPTLALTGAVDQNGTGINVTETATETVVSIDQDTVDIINVLKNRPVSGRYVLESNNGTLSWVNIGTQTV